MAVGYEHRERTNLSIQSFKVTNSTYDINWNSRRLQEKMIAL